MKPWPMPPGELRKWKCLSPVHWQIPVSVNLTARRPRKPAWASGVIWPTAKAVGKEGAVMIS